MLAARLSHVKIKIQDQLEVVTPHPAVTIWPDLPDKVSTGGSFTVTEPFPVFHYIRTGNILTRLYNVKLMPAFLNSADKWLVHLYAQKGALSTSPWSHNYSQCYLPILLQPNNWSCANNVRVAAFHSFLIPGHALLIDLWGQVVDITQELIKQQSRLIHDPRSRNQIPRSQTYPWPHSLP